MITEDYVSFEIAKLLKEKEFDKYILITEYWYDANGIAHKRENYSYSSAPTYDNETCFNCPTLQLTMKLLREVYHIDIEVQTHYFGNLKPNNTRYYRGKILKSSEGVIHTIYTKFTYEEVCEAAIKYCLENLI